MLRRRSLSVCLFALLAARAGAIAVIDDFTAGTDDLSGASGSHLTVDPGILGGERLTEFTLVSGSTWNPAVGIAPTATYLGETGWMFYSSTFNNLATWSVTYGASQDLDSDWTACGAQSLRLGAGGQIDVDANGNPNGVWGADGTPVTVTLWSNGFSRSVSRVLYGNPVESQGLMEYEFLFSDFPGINFSDVDRVRFQFHQVASNPAVDYGIHSIALDCNRSLDTPDQPLAFALDQAFPNPFNPATTLGFRLAETGPATLAVYDLTGRHIATLVDGLVGAGEHRVQFDGAGLPSGVYFYTLTAGSQRETRRMVLLK